MTAINNFNPSPINLPQHFETNNQRTAQQPTSNVLFSGVDEFKPNKGNERFKAKEAFRELFSDYNQGSSKLPYIVFSSLNELRIDERKVKRDHRAQAFEKAKQPIKLADIQKYFAESKSEQLLDALNVLEQKGLIVISKDFGSGEVEFHITDLGQAALDQI